MSIGTGQCFMCMWLKPLIVDIRYWTKTNDIVIGVSAQGTQPTGNQLQLNIQKSQSQQAALRGKSLSQTAGQR